MESSHAACNSFIISLKHSDGQLISLSKPGLAFPCPFDVIVRLDVVYPEILLNSLLE